VRLPSNARDPRALAVTAPVSAVVFASKLPPIVMGQVTRTSPRPTRHVFGVATVAPTRTRPTIIHFMRGPSTAQVEKITRHHALTIFICLICAHSRIFLAE
jgi:hypothetical protein